MGWYHSHPFDVDEQHSHCYLSNTDLSTQLQWQRAEDPHGVCMKSKPLRGLCEHELDLRWILEENASLFAHIIPSGYRS